jgi:hypothetical protein
LLRKNHILLKKLLKFDIDLEAENWPSFLGALNSTTLGHVRPCIF